VFLAPFALFTACDGEPVASHPLSGTYILESIGGEHLPYTLTPGSDDVWMFVTESMALALDGSVHVSVTTRHVNAARGVDSLYHSEIDARYIRDRDRLTIVYPPCGPAANCAPPPVGRIVDDRLIFTWFDPPQAAVFRQAGSR
jgi:hypothetical protein